MPSICRPLLLNSVYPSSSWPSIAASFRCESILLPLQASDLVHDLRVRLVQLLTNARFLNVATTSDSPNIFTNPYSVRCSHSPVERCLIGPNTLPKAFPSNTAFFRSSAFVVAPVAIRSNRTFRCTSVRAPYLTRTHFHAFA